MDTNKCQITDVLSYKTVLHPTVQVWQHVTRSFAGTSFSFMMLHGNIYGEKNYVMLSRFHTIPACYRRTDRQTDRIAISISRVSVLTRDNKNGTQYI